MKTINNKITLMLLTALSLTFFNCASEDEFDDRISIPFFQENDLSIIHGDSEKSWRITEVINEFYDPNYALEVELSCLADDVYTFHKDDLSFSVDLGEDKCFGQNDSGIFKADEEIFDGELIYMPGASIGGNKTIFLRYSRGYVNENGSAQGISIRFFKLAELSEDRMVFYREGAEFVGEYREALIFEAI